MIMVALLVPIFALYSLFLEISLPQIDWKISGTAFLILGCLDQWSTVRFLKKGCREGNFIWRFLFRKIGPKRSRIIWGIFFILIIISPLWKTIGAEGQLALITTQALVIIWNIILPEFKKKLQKSEWSQK